MTDMKLATSALSGDDYHFAYDGEIPELDEGFDGLDCYYAADIKTVGDALALPIESIKHCNARVHDYRTMPYANEQDEFGGHGHA